MKKHISFVVQKLDFSESVLDPICIDSPVVERLFLSRLDPALVPV